MARIEAGSAGIFHEDERALEQGIVGQAHHHRIRELFTQQRQSEVLRIIYTNAQEKVVAPSRASGGNRELRLQINREPPKPKVLDQPKGDGH